MAAPATFRVEDIYSVKGLTVVVTGGGTGLGKAIAAAYVANGAKVFITGRRKDVIDATAAELGQTAAQGGAIFAIQGDVSTKAGAGALYEAVKAQTSVVDVLVNCAGIMRSYRNATTRHNDPDEVVRTLWDGHEDRGVPDSCPGVYWTTVAFTPLLQASDLKSVIVIASIAGLINQRAMGSVSYGVSKAGAIHCATLLAGRLSPLKIRVNTIAPGIFPSEMTGSSTDNSGHGYDLGGPAIKAAKRSVTGRAGLPHEIIGPVLMLGSRAGSYMNNAMLVVDGGRAMVAGIHDGLHLPADTYMD
ncbi:hypothetical protein Q5752_007038 [Cryptotrichosporon argae]